MYGNSIRNPGGMAAARGMTGVCPQFDVLWGELTAMEHMMLYADIKGMPWAARQAAAAALLDKVRGGHCRACIRSSCKCASHR